MFQRLKDAIDNRIAEEQARQQATLQSTFRPNDSSSPSAHRALSRNISPANLIGQSGEEVALSEKSPHPSEFDLVSALRGDAAISGSGPSQEAAADDSLTQNPDINTSRADSGEQNLGAEDGVVTTHEAAMKNSPAEVGLEKRKLGRLEKKHQELLKAYRIAYGRVQRIEPFEASLRENTPLTSIDDPSAFLEYLNQMNVKSDMILDELKRVASERDYFRKMSGGTEKELESLKVGVASEIQENAVETTCELPEDSLNPGETTSIAAGEPAGFVEFQPTSGASRAPSPTLFLSRNRAVVSPSHTKCEADEFFSYDTELPRLQVELQEQQEETADLKIQVSTLQKDLFVARESTEGMVQSLERATCELQAQRDSNRESEEKNTTLKCQAEASGKGKGNQSTQHDSSTLTTEIPSTDLLVVELEASLSVKDSALATMAKTLKEAEVSCISNRREAADLRQQKSRKEARIKELEDSYAATLSADTQKAQHSLPESTNQKQIRVLNNLLNTLRTQLQTAEAKIFELKDLKETADMELKNLRRNLPQGIHNGMAASELGSEGIDESLGYIAELPSTKYFGFVNEEAFSLTGDLPNALRRFAEVMKITKPELYQALVSVEKGNYKLGVPADVSAVSNSIAKKSKKKNKKKGSKADHIAATQNAQLQSTKVTEMLDEVHNRTQKSDIGASADFQALRDQIIELETQIKDKDTAALRLSERILEQAALHEEIETLRDDLLHQGEEHVEARAALKAIRLENAVLRERMNVAEKEQAGATSAGPNKAHQESSPEAIELRNKNFSLQRDLTASEQLATARFKDVTDLREVLSKAQPELRNLRSEVENLRPIKDEFRSKTTELNRLDLSHKDSLSNLKGLSQKFAEKEADLNDLKRKLNDEKRDKKNVEEDLRVTKADFQHAEGARIAAVKLQVENSEKLTKVGADLSGSEIKIQALKEKIGTYAIQIEALKKEIDMKSTLHDSGQAVVTGLREQTLELSTQARETSSRADSLEEELAETRRMLTERSRDAETMRRLLAEAEGRTSTRISEMQKRMEIAIEERSQMEDEASTKNRRIAYEIEDLRNKAREANRSLRIAEEEKAELGYSCRGLLRTRDEMEAAAETSQAEVRDVQAAVQTLRDVLDRREKEEIEHEHQRSESKRMLEDMQETVERLRKTNKRLTEDSRGAQLQRKESAHLPTEPQPESGSLRSSFDPVFNAENSFTMPPMPHTPDKSSTSRSSTPTHPVGSKIDSIYLKHVLLQFFEQKDKNHQRQLIPVLRKLLNFDRTEEQKWMAAITTK